MDNLFLLLYRIMGCLDTTSQKLVSQKEARKMGQTAISK
jgi:hypothetical protein